jgi:hypothetical protein
MPTAGKCKPNADERFTLTGWLDWQRATVCLKCAGLDSAAHRQYVPTSPAMTIAGIVRHLAHAERHWMVRSFLGDSVSPAPRWWGESDEPLHSSLDAYEAQCERSASPPPWPPGHLARTHRRSPWLLAPTPRSITREATPQAGRLWDRDARAQVQFLMCQRRAGQSPVWRSRAG